MCLVIIILSVIQWYLIWYAQIYLIKFWNFLICLIQQNSYRISVKCFELIYLRLICLMWPAVYFDCPELFNYRYILFYHGNRNISVSFKSINIISVENNLTAMINESVGNLMMQMKLNWNKDTKKKKKTRKIFFRNLFWYAKSIITQHCS